jgi:hypothetical protein
MKRRRAVPADIAFTQHRVAAGSITLPTHWSPEQAVAVFERLDELREHVWARYGLQIQQVLRDERSTAVPAAHIDIDEGDVPF